MNLVNTRYIHIKTNKHYLRFNALFSLYTEYIILKFPMKTSNM